MSLTTGIQTLDDLDLENQVVLVRADLDAPLSKGGAVADDWRIAETVSIVKRLQEASARVVLASRFGEANKAPNKKNGAPPSIEPAAARLSELCECDVFLPDGCSGDAVKKVLLEMRPTQACVLENLASVDDRGPQAEGFARQLLAHAEIYVADSVRALSAHSATTTILPRLSEHRAASPSMMRELSALDRVQSGIDNPRIIVWGGNALSSRLELLQTLAGDEAQILLCGVAAITMIRAQGGAIGRSSVEEDYLAGARTLADQLGNRLIVPTDFIAAESPKSEEGVVREANEIPSGEMALDIGPQTQKQYGKMIHASRTAIWCGTVGFHKSAPFAGGTRTICEAFAQTSAFTLVAGDDSVAAARAVGADTLPKIDCVARGGQATLALLNNNKLPGLEALRGTNE